MTARTAVGPVAALAGGLGLAAIAWLGSPAPGTSEFAQRAAQQIGDDPDKPIDYFKEGGGKKGKKKAGRSAPQDAEPDEAPMSEPRGPVVLVDAAAIAAALAGMRTELDACGSAAKAKNPDLPAEVTWTLHATPDDDGTSTVRSVTSSLGPIVDKCASVVLSGMRLATPNPLQVDTTWTFGRP